MAEQPSQTKPVFQTADVPAGPTVTPASDISKPKTIKKEENQMADDVTNRDFFDIRGDIKDSRYNIVSQIDRDADRLQADITDSKDVVIDRLWSLNRDLMDTRTQVAGLGYQVRDGFVAAAKDSEINALKTQVELAKQTTYLSDKIDGGNAETQRLINELKDRDLNRLLIERNAALVEEAHWGRHWRHGVDQSNWQAVSNRLNSLDSQFAEARQGMVNFGTMAGVGQTSTNNNVK